MNKQYVSDFERSEDAWKFITANFHKLSKSRSNGLTLGVEKRKGKYWVVLKRQ